MHQILFRLGLHRLLAGFKGPASKRREGGGKKGMEGDKGRNREEGEGGERKDKETEGEGGKCNVPPPTFE